MTRIKLLLIEDNDIDALLLIRQLRKDGFEPDHLQVKTRDEMEKAMENNEWDLVVSDYSLPGFGGGDALELFKSRNLDIPFILVSGTVGEDIAVNIMKGGANDYLMKTHLNRLGPAVKRELEETVMRREKRQAEKELILAKQAAEESSRLKSALLQNMSHEFRTPMNGILGFSELLNGELTDPRTRMMAEHILTSGLRLQQTLDSIMLFAQLESGIALRQEEADLTDEIARIAATQTNPIARKGLQLELPGKSSVKIITDRHLLGRAIANIFDNAVKFTSQGTVSVDLALSGPVQSMVTITVRDTGIGISPEKHNLIFDEFRQAEEGYNRPYEGSGLGLAIARKCVSLLGGTIGVQSELGKGSTFIITIPTNTTRPEEAGRKSPQQPLPETGQAGAEPPSVLLVEDNDANIELVRIYLKNDYLLDVAKDGESSLEMVRKKRYEIILMDINLGPGMDGIDAIAAIRQMEEYKKTPIIAVTGYTFRNEKEFIISKGADHYLEKPFLKKTLVDLMEKVTG
jgi:signal transduction histidine kinase